MPDTQAIGALKKKQPADTAISFYWVINVLNFDLADFMIALIANNFI